MTKRDDADGNDLKSYRFICSECHILLEANTKKAGTQTQCPNCLAEIIIPLNLIDEHFIYATDRREAVGVFDDDQEGDEQNENEQDFEESHDDEDLPNPPLEHDSEIPLNKEFWDKVKKTNKSFDSSLNMILGLLGIMCAILVFGCIINGLFFGSATGTEDKVGAWVAAQEFVTERLRSPSTADFGGLFGQSSDECVKFQGNDEYVVTGWVDSQNGFGAIVRTNFTLRLRNNGNDSWSLIGQPVMNQR